MLTDGLSTNRVLAGVWLVAEDRDTLEFVYEPYLIQEGFLVRTPRGRQVTRRTYEHLGLPPPARGQGTLF